MKFIFASFLLLAVITSQGQPEPLNKKLADSLIQVLPSIQDNQIKVDGLNKLARMYTGSDHKRALGYTAEAIRLARVLNYRDGLIAALAQSGFIKAASSQWPQSIHELNEAMQYLDENDERMIMFCGFMFVNFATKGEFDEGIKWAKRAYEHPLFNKISEANQWPAYMQMGIAYDGLANLDSARKYANLCVPLIDRYGAKVSPELTELSYSLLASIATKDGDFAKALSYYKKANNYVGVAEIFDAQKQSDSAIYYARIGLSKAQFHNTEEKIQLASSLLAKNLETRSQKEANEYLKMYIESRERQFNGEKLKQLEAIKLNEQNRAFETERNTTAQRNLVVISSIIGIMLLIVGFLVFAIRSNKLIKITNRNLSKTLNDLKSAQSQLIQSEKMASLGELTAGIAHEIQNPLNFVNNFSEVNTELIEELEQEVNKGNLAEVKLLAKDIRGNEQKINHHGKRAGDIVKSMLQHSRSSSSVKEPTNINTLTDEYLRLAYHGLRAKDKTFNATMKTDFDETIGSINVIPQDIGRVILNLITNAFYVVNEREKSGIENFEPTVSVSTKKVGDKILVSVKDNGNGIPDSVKEKIFQPFFTTKPTGQGTGLGLSLSYDIVKAHGGEIIVETKPGHGAEFIINLPCGYQR